MSSDAILELQRAVGNRAISRATSDDPRAKPEFVFDETMPANPVLWTDMEQHYWAGPDRQPEGYFVRVEQHCSYMSVYWLTHGHPNFLKFLDFDERTRVNASRTVIAWGSPGGGLTAQVKHAVDALHGKEYTRGEIIAAVTGGNLSKGARIWFGNNTHVEGALTMESEKYLHYDPNVGETKTLDKQQFADRLRSRNAFVVGNP